MHPLALEVNGVSSQLSIHGRCKEKNVKKDKIHLQIKPVIILEYSLLCLIPVLISEFNLNLKNIQARI